MVGVCMFRISWYRMIKFAVGSSTSSSSCGGAFGVLRITGGGWLNRCMRRLFLRSSISSAMLSSCGGE